MTVWRRVMCGVVALGCVRDDVVSSCVFYGDVTLGCARDGVTSCFVR